MRTTFAEAAAFEGDYIALAELETARCSRDLCTVALAAKGGKPITLMVTRSSLLVPYPALVAACAQADIVIADRALPRGCVPRWARLDRPALSAMGGARIMIADRQIIGGRDPRDRHPWVVGAAGRQSGDWRSRRESRIRPGPQP